MKNVNTSLALASKPSPNEAHNHFEDYKEAVDFYVALAARLHSWSSELYELQKEAAIKPLAGKKRKRFLDLNSSLHDYYGHLEDYVKPLPDYGYIRDAMKAA